MYFLEITQTLTALVGILGTLSGAALGAFVTWKIQKYQLEHADRTRFHDRRLTIYAAFNDACQQVVAAAIGGLPSAEPTAKLVTAYKMFRLMASRLVAQKAGAVHGSVCDICNAASPPTPAALAKYHSEMVALVNAIRAEIGVDVPR